MADGDKAASSQHAYAAVEHEAILTGVMALANLFSNCVEAFGLISPSHRWEKEEQLALCRLGIQQARLLIWGDVVGVSSPPASVTDRAVPRHPSAAYPDLKEPTFFGARDARLDETETRKMVENALSAIVDRSASATREEMMDKYGLKPPKRFAADYQPALDTNRLEAFRERYELLKEVAESYAHINTRRTASIVQTSWMIADFARFSDFIKLTQEKIDFLIGALAVKERVDRAMCMDIKALGWHLSADRTRSAMDTSKLKLIQEACRNEYPEYLGATEQALKNIERERRENVGTYNPYAAAPIATPIKPPKSPKTPRARQSSLTPQTANGTNGASHHPKRPGLLGGFLRSFRKSHDGVHQRSASLSAASATSPTDEPLRSLSDAGPQRADPHDDMNDLEPTRSKSVGALPEPLVHVRSKSVGDILEVPADHVNEQIIQTKLERLNTNATVKEPLDHSSAIDSAISRHDQFHGLGRQGTKGQ